MDDHYCMKCSRLLTRDEIALHRKIVNRGATEFMCIDCIGAYYDIPVETLRDRIEYFKKTGCTLFFM